MTEAACNDPFCEKCRGIYAVEPVTVAEAMTTLRTADRDDAIVAMVALQHEVLRLRSAVENCAEELRDALEP